MDFNPNAVALNDSGIFGLPYTYEQSALVFLPIPWHVTTSYGKGTANGPAAILQASDQLDLYHQFVKNPYRAGLHCLPESEQIRAMNDEGSVYANLIIEKLKDGVDADTDGEIRDYLCLVNEMGEKLNTFVREQTLRILNDGKIAAIIGGDHSVPFGAFQAIAEMFGPFAILHFDAHHDLRCAYEGFEWSHASIMYNALMHIPQMKKLVSVGIRDCCEEEVEFAKQQSARVATFYDRNLQRHKFRGNPWNQKVLEILSHIPKDLPVWISFDIDGLDPRFCPHTGTPVPGGLDLEEAKSLIEELSAQYKILGFDLNEVAPNPHDESDEWDANVGMRLLYELLTYTLLSQGKVKLNKPE